LIIKALPVREASGFRMAASGSRKLPASSASDRRDTRTMLGAIVVILDAATDLTE